MTDQPDAIESAESFCAEIAVYARISQVNAVKERDEAIEARARADERARAIEECAQHLASHRRSTPQHPYPCGHCQYAAHVLRKFAPATDI